MTRIPRLMTDAPPRRPVADENSPAGAGTVLELLLLSLRYREYETAEAASFSLLPSAGGMRSPLKSEASARPAMKERER